MKSGSIIQFHTGTEHTAEALPEILNYLEYQKLTAVTVGELIYYENYIIAHNGTQIKTESETSEL